MVLEERVEALEEHTVKARRTGSTKYPPGANLLGCMWFLGFVQLKTLNLGWKYEGEEHGVVAGVRLRAA